MRRTSVAAAAGLAVVAAAVARACFLGASWQLLDDRMATLRAPPTNSFVWEVRRLAPASPWYRPLPASTSAPDDAQNLHDRAERAGLNGAQVAALAAMRAAPDSRWALAAAGGLPKAIRLYTGGAVAFLHHNLTDAREYFSFVLALPPAEAAPRAVWAQYMLGRIAAKAGRPDEAEAAWKTLRGRVAQGAPDPLGLAVASLGDQARLALDRGDVPEAIKLYAEQVADGSDEAVQSLRMVAERAMKAPDGFPKLVGNPLVQRLLVVHALALTGDYLHQLLIGGAEGGIAADGYWPPENLDTRPLAALLAAVRASATAAEPDRLAALAYRLGDTGAARDLAARTATPLALWVRAKLALEDGGDAAKLFAAALHAAEADRTPVLEPSSTGLLRGETAVATLVRGDFVQAAETMWPVAATYWGDFAYLTERVLTTDELLAFARKHAPAMAATAPDEVSTPNELRNLLARRLMRDGRTQDALAWFDTANRPAAREASETPHDSRTEAAEYASAVSRAGTAFWATPRARAGWHAASLLRSRGMELMGTEEDPDQADVGGEFPYWLGPGPAGPAAKPGGLTAAEIIRYERSRAQPNLRFHYRYLAVEQAVAAAGELPPRSQAAAAILCHAATWSFSTNDTERARAIWHRYTATGARVPFARHFGRACPAPDFDAVWQTRSKLAVIDIRNTVHRHKPAFLGGGALVLLAAMGTVVRRRRARPEADESPKTDRGEDGSSP